MESARSDLVDQRARQAGLTLTPAELETLAPIVGRTLAMLGRLESLPLAGVEPAIQYRIL